MDGDFRSVERDYALISSQPGPASDRPVDPPAGEPPRTPYPPAAALPTVVGPRGIRFDINHGARVLLPTAPTASGASASRISTPAIFCSKAKTAEPSSIPPSAILFASASRCGTTQVVQTIRRIPGFDTRTTPDDAVQAAS